MNKTEEIQNIAPEVRALHELARHDKTVMSYIEFGTQLGEPIEKTLIKLIIGLAKEKENYFNEILKLKGIK